MSELVATLLKVYRTRNGKSLVCEVLCPKCGEIHHHGYESEKMELSSRVPHCWDEKKVKTRGFDWFTEYSIQHGYPDGYGYAAPQFVLYRMFNAHGELLYLGQTISPRTRMKNHAQQRDWWHEVVNITLERFCSSQELNRVEKIAIQTEHPRYNKQHNMIEKD